MGLLANLPIGLAPGLGLNAYVSPVSQASIFSFSNQWTNKVRIFCCRFSWKWYHHISWSSSGRVPRGVGILLRAVCLCWLYLLPIQLVISSPLHTRPPSMAGAHNASIARPCSWCRNRAVHCVSEHFRSPSKSWADILFYQIHWVVYEAFSWI
jgi:hypothetical protein